MHNIRFSFVLNRQAVRSVSYTHLDVYKRQLLRCSSCCSRSSSAGSICTASLAVTMPSWTPEMCIRDRILRQNVADKLIDGVVALLLQRTVHLQHRLLDLHITVITEDVYKRQPPDQRWG